MKVQSVNAISKKRIDVLYAQSLEKKKQTRLYRFEKTY